MLRIWGLPIRVVLGGGGFNVEGVELMLGSRV